MVPWILPYMGRQLPLDFLILPMITNLHGQVILHVTCRSMLSSLGQFRMPSIFLTNIRRRIKFLVHWPSRHRWPLKLNLVIWQRDEKYIEAADFAQNSFNTPLFLMKRELYELNGHSPKAWNIWKNTVNPESTEGASLKNIARIKLLKIMLPNYFKGFRAMSYYFLELQRFFYKILWGPAIYQVMNPGSRSGCRNHEVCILWLTGMQIVLQLCWMGHKNLRKTRSKKKILSKNIYPAALTYTGSTVLARYEDVRCCNLSWLRHYRVKHPHFTFICQGAVRGITQLNLDIITFIFGVLTTATKQQGIDRAGGKHGNKGDEAAVTAIRWQHSSKHGE